MDQTSQIPWTTILTVATTVGGFLLAFLLIPRIVLQQRESATTLAWILLIVFVPYLGAALFFIVGRTRVRRRTKRKIESRNLLDPGINSLTRMHAENDPVTVCPIDSSPLGKVSRVVQCMTGKPPLAGNRTEIFIDAGRAYDSMEQAIRDAKHHVHMMSYLFRSDQAGIRFRDLLTQKAKENIEVRLLVDAVGSHRLDESFIHPLLTSGGSFSRFMPVIPLRPHWRPNLRNHRKILVVDGKTGFAGGLNIGDEYQGRKKKYAPWRDTHMKIEGPAVRRMQEIFAEDWFFASDEDLLDPDHFPHIEPQGEEIVHVVESGPDQPHENIHAVFFNAITESTSHLFITTPYFIPDPAILLALKVAGWRGVDVRILLPGKSDLKLIQTAGRSYYRELLQAGVRIYEHRPGVLHAKTMVVDRSWATIGSANMDIRSFRLNFEVNILSMGSNVASQLEKIFFADIEKSKEITLDDLPHTKPTTRFAQAIARVLAPVL